MRVLMRVHSSYSQTLVYIHSIWSLYKAMLLKCTVYNTKLLHIIEQLKVHYGVAAYVLNLSELVAMITLEYCLYVYMFKLCFCLLYSA